MYLNRYTTSGLSPLHTQKKTIKFALRPVESFKFDERSGNVVKNCEICNFHVHTTLLLRRCHVLTASNTFILGSYYAPITRALGPTSSCDVCATSKKIAPRAYHGLTASFQSLQIQCCSTSFRLEKLKSEHRL